jgi:hypothetical protein
VFSAVLLSMAVPARALVRVMYSPRSALTQAGTLGDPGWASGLGLAYNSQSWYSSSNQLIGPRGKPLPFAVSVTSKLDNNTFSYSPQVEFLGANLQFSVDPIFWNGRYAAADPFFGGPGSDGGGAGLSNIELVLFSFGWSLE